jgi:hypothetical protein
MLIVIVIVVLVVIAGSFWADYRWRQWMRARQRERSRGDERDVN